MDTEVIEELLQLLCKKYQVYEDFFFEEWEELRDGLLQLPIVWLGKIGNWQLPIWKKKMSQLLYKSALTKCRNVC